MSSEYNDLEQLDELTDKIGSTCCGFSTKVVISSLGGAIIATIATLPVECRLAVFDTMMDGLLDQRTQLAEWGSE